MPRPKKNPLDPVARAITDGERVNWEALSASHPEFRSKFEKLRLIQNLLDSAPRTGTELGSSSAGDEAHTAQPTAIALPFRWGPLEVLEKVGAGSFGDVYRAFDPLLQREVALKLRRIHGEAAREAFTRHLEEARRLARVRHPGVLAIHGVEVHDDRAGLWTDFLRGETLETSIAGSDPLAAPQIVEIGLELCQALAAVHASGIVHGDIKAANVMREASGRIVLMDFGAGSILFNEETGAARSSDATPPTRRGSSKPPAGGGSSKRTARSTSGTGSLIGTPLVMAPELFEGASPSKSSDLYALGVLLHRLASGRYPIEARTRDDLLQAHRQRTRIPLVEVRPDLPVPLLEAIDRALAFNPDDRFNDAAELEAALSAALEHGDTPVATRRRSVRPNSLPQPQDRFLGREQDRVTLRQTVWASALVTLVGPGGTGKTRLALETAAELLDRFVGGGWWIDLAPLDREEQVWEGIARALGVRVERFQRVEEAILQHLGDTSLLLVLDNCEHLVAACRRVAESLVSSAPSLRILATSREALGSPMESVHRVSPLSLPPSPSRQKTKVEGLEIVHAEAVRLFLDRAYHARSTFALTRKNASSVAQICRRLEGIPLAIELAAARVRTMSTEEIATRLEESFRIVAGAGEGRQPHHRTLEASIEWSHRLLDEQEQALLRRLSVFSGHSSLEAAETICADRAGDDGLIQGIPVLDLLTSLVEKSLLLFDAPDEDHAGGVGARAMPSGYRMLEMVRRFAAHKLHEAREEEIYRGRHLEFFLALSESATSHLTGPSQDDWFRRLERDLDNFRAALAWSARAPGSGDLGLRTAIALRQLWLIRGLVTEGLEIYRTLLAYPGMDPILRGRGLVAAAGLSVVPGDETMTRAYIEEAISLQRATGDERGLLSALATLGTLEIHLGNLGEARRLYEEALVLQRQPEYREGLPVTLVNLGVAHARSGDLDAAEACYREALDVSRQLGDRPREGGCLMNLAATAKDRGDFETARALTEEAITILRSAENRTSLRAALSQYAVIQLQRRDLVRARLALQENLELDRSAGDRIHMLHSLSVFSDLLMAEGRMEPAARLLGALTTLRDRMRTWARDREEFEGKLAVVRESLGADLFASAFAGGRGLTLEQATAVALDDARAE